MAMHTPVPKVIAADGKTADKAGSSQGMPARTPAAGRPRPGRAEAPQDASDEASLALPHERDQSTDMTDKRPDPQVRQAQRDLSRGLQDTDKSPAMNKTYQQLKNR